jgi:hypothetical protein
MAFPDPNQNTTYKLGSKTWDWDGQKWVLKSISVGLPDFRSEHPVTVDESNPGVVMYGYDADQLTDLT